MSIQQQHAAFNKQKRHRRKKRPTRAEKTLRQKVAFELEHDYPWPNRRSRWPLITKSRPNMLAFVVKSDWLHTREWRVVSEDAKTGYMFMGPRDDTASGSSGGVASNALSMTVRFDGFSNVLHILYTRLWLLDYICRELRISKAIVRIIDEYHDINVSACFIAKPHRKYMHGKKYAFGSIAV